MQDAGVLGKNILGGGNSSYKGLDVEVSLVCLRNPRRPEWLGWNVPEGNSGRYSQRGRDKADFTGSCRPL